MGNVRAWQKTNKQTNKQKVKKMKRYQLFSEFCDEILWGADLPDALKRAGKIQRHASFDRDAQRSIPGETLKIGTILGMRDTSQSTRGHWKFESAIVELEHRQIIEIDARCLEMLK